MRRQKRGPRLLLLLLLRVLLDLALALALRPRARGGPGPSSGGARSPRAPAPKRLVEPPRLPLALLELRERLAARLERVLRHLELDVLLVPVDEQLLDDRRELRVLVQRLLPVLLDLLQLCVRACVRRWTARDAEGGGEERGLTRRVVDMYVASMACPVFSIAPASSPVSFRLKPFHAAPRSIWSCACSANQPRAVSNKPRPCGSPLASREKAHSRIDRQVRR